MTPFLLNPLFFGVTDRERVDILERLYSPHDYAETIYRKLRINTDQRLRIADGRTVEFTDGGGRVADSRVVLNVFSCGQEW